MRVLVTGANGFVGKNLVTSLRSIQAKKENHFDLNIEEIYEYDVNNSMDELDVFTSKCDYIINLAGVNRPKNINEFYEGNTFFAQTMCDLLKKHNNQSPIVNSSSTQAELDNDYGKSKRAGEEYLESFGKENGNKIFNYRFANLFGKWCRPNYNSVTATWCYNVAHGLDIVVNNRESKLLLCYIDDVIEEIFSCMIGHATQVGTSFGVDTTFETTLGELSDTILQFKQSRDTKNVMIQTPLNKRLYATYLSYLPQDNFSYPLTMNIDHRGSFSEFLKTKEFGQVSINVSKPGIVKGNHWHHTKNEKFLVVSGQGVIRFRDITSNTIKEYFVSGDVLEVVDIPVGYTHNIENIGNVDLVTVMWANECFDQNKPDTYFEEV